MRITKGQLRRIIKEEVNRTNRTRRTRRSHALRKAAEPNYHAVKWNMDKWMHS